MVAPQTPDTPSILFVSVAFPPKFDSEGLQVAKYVKYLFPLCQGSLDFHVVTSREPTLNMPVDPSLRGLGEDVRCKQQLTVYENRYFNYLLRKLWPRLHWSPDSKFTFHWQWRAVLRALSSKPALIYSRSFPASSAVLAMKLKRALNVPWIFHLSDLWADSPHIEYGSEAIRNQNQRLERECFAAADVISVTSQGTLDYYARKYADLGKRFEIYPNVFDPQDVSRGTGEPPPRGRPIRIVHTGGLAGSRTPEPFLKAWSTLPAEVRQNLEVVFAGHVDRENRHLMDRYLAPGCRYIGPLSKYRDAIELQQWADVLLLIDFPVARRELRGYFLSKLLDYHMTGKPVLAITDAGSECERFVVADQGHSFERSDVHGIQQYLRWLADRSCGDDFFRLRPLQQAYSADFNAQRLSALFHEVAGNVTR